MRLLPGLSPLRHRDFALYWVGQCVSQIGTFIEMNAMTYLLYAITCPQLIPRADFQNAVTLSSVIFRLSTLLGPAIAGILIAAVSPASPFFVNAASYFAIIFALLAIRTKFNAVGGPRESLRRSAWGGI